MKNFIKGRWFPLLLVVAIVLVIISVLFFCGFRITYARELEINWDAIAACAALAGAIGTIVVLIYNHIAIELTQKSVRQAVDLQLFEKRLELYNAIANDTAFYSVPLSIKIAYNDEIYQLYSDIVMLCEKRWMNIWEFAQVFHDISLESKEHGNVCRELYEEYTERIESEIQMRQEGTPEQYTGDGKVNSLQNHKANTDSLHKAICQKYDQLERKMRTVLNQSIN